MEFRGFRQAKENLNDNDNDGSKHFDRRRDESAEGAADLWAITLDGLHSQGPAHERSIAKIH